MQRHVIIGSTPDDRRYSNKIIKWGSQGKLGDRVNVVALDDPRFYDEDGYLMRDQVSLGAEGSGTCDRTGRRRQYGSSLAGLGR
jgi:hypothetical protein